MRVIEKTDLKIWLVSHTKWVFNDTEIVFEHNFGNFVEAFGFLTRVAILAEKHDHHPTMTNTYGHVRLSMATHDAGNKITDRDLRLAEKIEELL